MVASAALGSFHGIGYQTLIARISSREHRATLYGGLLSLWNAMFIIGPLIGGMLYFFVPSLPFMLGGILLLIIIVPVLKIRYSREH